MAVREDQAGTLRKNVQHWHDQFVVQKTRADGLEERLRLVSEDNEYQATVIKGLNNRIKDLEHRLRVEGVKV